MGSTVGTEGSTEGSTVGPIHMYDSISYKYYSELIYGDYPPGELCTKNISFLRIS